MQLRFAFHEYPMALEVTERDAMLLQDSFAQAKEPTTSAEMRLMLAIQATQRLLNLVTGHNTVRAETYKVRENIKYVFNKCGLFTLDGGSHSQVFTYTDNKIVRVFHDSDGWIEWARFIFEHSNELSKDAQEYLPKIDTLYKVYAPAHQPLHGASNTRYYAAIVERCLPAAPIMADNTELQALACEYVFNDDIRNTKSSLLRRHFAKHEFIAYIDALQEIAEHPECPSCTDVFWSNYMYRPNDKHLVLTDPCSFWSDSIGWFHINGRVKGAA